MTMYSEEVLAYGEEVKQRAMKNKHHQLMAKRKREEKGLKTNRITENEILSILNHWFDNGMDNLTKSFTYLYTSSKDYNNKEKDWVKSMVSNMFYQEQLVRAIDRCSHPTMKIIKESIVFTNGIFKSKRTLSARIRTMIDLYNVELKLIEKDNIITNKDKEIEELRQRLNSELGWEALAEILIKENKLTIKEVADHVEKSIPTINRLKKKLKSKGII